MSKRDWRSYGLIGGVVALLAIIIAVGNWAQNFDDHKRQEEHKAGRYQRSSEQAPPVARRPKASGARIDQPSCDAPKNHQEADECAQVRMAKSAEEMARLTKWQLFVGAAGFAALIVTLYLTMRALRESKRSADIAERGLVAGHRAFVFASGLVPEWSLDETTGQYSWRFRATWQNSGETPTINLRLVADAEIRDAPLPVPFAFPARAPGRGLLGPKANSLGGPGPSPPAPPISAQDIADSVAGKKYIYFWGWVRYFDVFPNTPEHVTMFCWLITTTGDPFAFDPANPASLSFAYLHTSYGNCADEECHAHQPAAV